jgi:signal transduction histidine kinase
MMPNSFPDQIDPRSSAISFDNRLASDLPRPGEMKTPGRAARLVRLATRVRWLVPLVLLIVGVSYVLWENFIIDSHPFFSAPLLLGLAMLGVAAPLITFLALTWAQRAAILFEHAEQRREREHQQLLMLNKIGEAVNQSLELDAVLNRAIDQVLELLHLESGEVRLIEEGQLILRTSRRVSEQFLATERVIPMGQCLCGKAAQTGQIVAIEDIGKTRSLTGTACACERFHSVLSVPVRTADRVVGVIHVASKTARTFDTNERDLLMAVGQQIGVAIEKARLLAQLKRLNQELEERVVTRTRELIDAREELIRKADTLHQILNEERRVEERTRAHIAHDLHDSVQQLIIGALFEIQSARDSLARNPDMTAVRLSSTQDLLRRIELEMRRAIYSLRPTALDAHGLVPALREYADGFSRHSGIECVVTVDGTQRRFNPECEVAAFRITQEALNNIEAHAAAKHAQIHLAWGVRDLRIEIVDDGKGFDIAEVTQQPRSHLGLIGMAERAESVGGALAVNSRVGEGTRVSLRVPVN